MSNVLMGKDVILKYKMKHEDDLNYCANNKTKDIGQSFMLSELHSKTAMATQLHKSTITYTRSEKCCQKNHVDY